MKDKRTLIATGLAAGEDDAALLLRFTAAGVSEASARYEIARLDKDPMATALRSTAARASKAQWLLDIPARLAGEFPDHFTLPVIDSIDPDAFYRDHYVVNRPAKLTGLIDQWPALTTWSLDHIAARVGDVAVEAQIARDADPDYEAAKDAHRRLVHFPELVQWLRANDHSNDIYVTAYNSGGNAAAFASLWADLGPIALLEARGAQDGFLWLGPAGTLTPWHHDLTNNLLVQVMGRKHIRLAPPWAASRMRNSRHCFSDWGNEPLAAGQGDATRPPVLECVLEPGDAIFLPVGWWHQVTALNLSASLTFTNFRGANAHVEDYRSYGAL